MNTPVKYVLTLSCPDTKGLVAAVASFLFNLGANILDAAQHRELSSEMFFMRTEFEIEEDKLSLEAFKKSFESLAKHYTMKWDIQSLNYKPKVLIMVSKFGHCLNHLIYRTETGFLPIDIVGVASNHTDFKEMTSWHKIPFYHLPVTKENKVEQEAHIKKLVLDLKVDLVVLARYMQILSDDLCRFLDGRAINIHHSFLPSFKGAKPYHQAFDRGVKIIGATAHYVTADLDEGPIIEQETMRVSHAHDANEFVSLGGDVESLVLSRAVKLHAEKRVLVDGKRTIVFS